jgi:hypothetical protein
MDNTTGIKTRIVLIRDKAEPPVDFPQYPVPNKRGDVFSCNSLQGKELQEPSMTLSE